MELLLWLFFMCVALLGYAALLLAGLVALLLLYAVVRLGVAVFRIGADLLSWARAGPA